MKKYLLLLLIFPIMLTAEENRMERPTVTQLFNVITVKVKKLESAKSHVNYGYIKAQDSLMVDVVPRYGGYVEKLYADTRYRKVKKGEPLAIIYSPEVLEAKEYYLTSLDFDSKHFNSSMLRSARSKLELLGLNQKEIDRVKNRRKSEESTTIYAPVTGWIFEKNINEGSAFSAKKRLFQIINLDTVWVEAKIYQEELPRLNSLVRFKIKVTGVNQLFDAKKILLYPEIDPKEATATLRLEIDNPQGLLKPGMYAMVTSSSDAKNRLVIPRTSAIRKNGKWYAFLATEFEGEYEPVLIEIKPLNKDHYEILSGLTESDKVVNNALFMMDSDAQINGLY